MVTEQNTYMYSFEFPEGKLFKAGDNVPDEFVDTPTKLGINKLDSKKEVERKCKNGAVTDSLSEDELEKGIELEQLKVAYMDKFGKAPHHKMKAGTIKKALE